MLYYTIFVAARSPTEDPLALAPEEGRKWKL